ALKLVEPLLERVVLLARLGQFLIVAFSLLETLLETFVFLARLRQFLGEAFALREPLSERGGFILRRLEIPPQVVLVRPAARPEFLELLFVRLGDGSKALGLLLVGAKSRLQSFDLRLQSLDLLLEALDLLLRLVEFLDHLVVAFAQPRIFAEELLGFLLKLRLALLHLAGLRLERRVLL